MRLDRPVYQPVHPAGGTGNDTAYGLGQTDNLEMRSTPLPQVIAMR
jgi:hypothetical protein